MKKPWCLLWPLVLMLSLAVPPADFVPVPFAESYPPCEPGFVQEDNQCVKCPDGEYWSQMNGHAKCNTCTTSCNVKKNLIEVTTCTKMTDRRCQCKPGFYCLSPVQLTCRRDCQPCTDGFTSAANVNRTCQLYTDCASLGMLVVKEGTSTTDRVCGHQTISRSSPDTPYLSSKLYNTTQSLFPQPKIAWTEGEGSVPPSEPLSKTTWIFLLLVLLALCLVSCLCLQCQRRAFKKNLVLAGRAFGRRQPMCPKAKPNIETLLPVAGGQTSFPGESQQVNIEHNGKADGINNTVGSIFIYSPGMVILGSNSSEKKGETEASEEDSGEDGRLISVPQQESRCERDIRTATQEELGKELSVPVPATSK